MLNNLRNFAKTKLAVVLVGIIIIPFVFWGMGGVFSGGNKNNIAKINDKSISTQDFVNYVNLSKIESDTIRKNIDNNIIEEILAELISKTMISMEINDLNLKISDKILKKTIKENNNFKDENNNFSRIKYEKFLLSSNLSAPAFESRLRENELRKKLFSYVSGGLNSPLFLVNNTYKEQSKKVKINYINLENIYKKKEDFSSEEISKFIDEHNDTLKEKIISFRYSKITPKDLIGIDEFNNLFFEKIDDIENEISNGTTLENLLTKYQLKSNLKENFNLNEGSNDNEFYKKIYENAENNKLKLLDENDFYILYEISDIKEVLPNIENENFITEVKELLFNESKHQFNYNLIQKISKKKFNQKDFDELSKMSFAKIENIEINSIKDNNKFSVDSIKYLYTLSKNNYALISDKDKNIYLIKIINISVSNISKNSEDFPVYKEQTNIKLRDNIYSSYDFFLNNKYKIKINEKTVERVKNYFR